MTTTIERVAALTAAAGLAGIVLFQLGLAAGAPFGRAAWGGTHPGVLPAQLRVASVVAALVWVAAALLVVRRAGLGLPALPDGLGPCGHLGPHRSVGARRGHERRLIQRLGAVLLGAVRPGPGRRVPA